MPRRRLRPALVSVLLMAALAGCGTTGGAGRAGQDALAAGPAAAAQRPAAEVIVPSCVPKYDAPPYQIGVVGSFSGGGLTVKPGVAVSDLSGVFCAVATVQDPPPDHPAATVCAAVTAPPEGLQFAPVTTQLTLLPGVRTVLTGVTITPESFTAFVCNDGLPGPIALQTTIRASAVPALFGTRCEVGPLSAAVTGSVTGPLDDLTGSVQSPPLPVAAVQPSALCPAGLASNTNDILGLPLPATTSGLSLQLHVSLYLPAQP